MAADLSKTPAPVVRPTRTMTPRAQMIRVMLGAVAAILVGAGPAIAWDVSTQPPRAEQPSSWPKPSPWKDAGKHMTDAVKQIARVYLPRSRNDVAEEEAAAAASAAAALSPPAPSSTTGPTGSAVAPSLTAYGVAPMPPTIYVR